LRNSVEFAKIRKFHNFHKSGSFHNCGDFCETQNDRFSGFNFSSSLIYFFPKVSIERSIDTYVLLLKFLIYSENVLR